MQHLVYFAFDVIVVGIALAVFWGLIKSVLILGVQPMRTAKMRNTKHGATRIQSKLSSARSVAGDSRNTFECHIVTPMFEAQDWHQYGVPTYIRRGIIVH